MSFAFFISVPAWVDIIADGTLGDVYGPADRYSVVMLGKLGTLFDIPVYTDGFNQIYVTKQESEIFVIPLDKAIYFSDELQPLLKNGQNARPLRRKLEQVVENADGDEILQMMAAKRLELEKYPKFNNIRQASNYIQKIKEDECLKK